MPGAVLDSSTPAAAITNPCLVCEIVIVPRLATTRTVSAATASSRDIAVTRPSALLTTFEVTMRMSPSSSPGPPGAVAASAISPARSAPADISGIPAMPKICTGSGAWPGAMGTAGDRPSDAFVIELSSFARSMAAWAIAADEGTSRMYSGSARTAIPARAGSSPSAFSTAALSWSSISQPLMSSGP